MSTVETEVTFRKKSEIHAPTELQLIGSKDFILITDHRTSKHKSIEQLQDAEDKNCCSTFMRNIFRKKTLYKRLPILTWLPQYSRADIMGDFIAGFTVGLTVIPQGLAYSAVAGLPTEYGLYGSFMGCFVYVVLGTCKDSTVGSTSIASLLVFQFAKGVWQRAVLLTFLTGLIEIVVAIFKLSFLVEFVSGPVSSGFTSAVTMIVFTSQMNYILGVKNDGATLVERWISIIGDIKSIRLMDATLGLGCVLLLLLLRYLGRIKYGPTDENLKKWYHIAVNKFIWFFSVTRNASIVIACTAISMQLESQGKHYFRLTGYIPPGIPVPSIPPFSIDAVPGNATLGIPEQKGETFFEMVNHMGYGLVIIPLIALLENIAVCKAFAKGKSIDASQELFAMGVANIANSCFKGYRANGGLARSAVNNASGVRTQLSNFYIGGIVVLSLLYCTEYFYFIPKAVLASVIIAAVIFQLQYHVVLPMWRSKRADLIPFFVALIACAVLPLEVGILLAIGSNLLFILYHAARPKVSLEELETFKGQKFLKLTPDRCLIFPSVEFVRNLVIKSCNKTALPVVIDCTYIYGADYTAAKVISSMIEDFKKRHQKIIFYNLKPSVVSIFEGLNTKLVLCYNIDALQQELATEVDPET